MGEGRLADMISMRAARGARPRTPVGARTVEVVGGARGEQGKHARWKLLVVLGANKAATPGVGARATTPDRAVVGNGKGIVAVGEVVGCSRVKTVRDERHVGTDNIGEGEGRGWRS
jgi:hypothetical protein